MLCDHIEITAKSPSNHSHLCYKVEGNKVDMDMVYIEITDGMGMVTELFIILLYLVYGLKCLQSKEIFFYTASKPARDNNQISFKSYICVLEG